MDGDVTIPETDPRHLPAAILRAWRDCLTSELAMVNGLLADIERPERQQRVMDQCEQALHENEPAWEPGDPTPPGVG